MNVLNREILARLVHGRSVDGIELPELNDRVLISGLKRPEQKSKSIMAIRSLIVSTVSGTDFWVGTRWNNIHFRNCDLSEICLKRSSLENCVFEQCSLERFGIWESTVTDCEFVSSKLHGCAFGGQSFKRPNRFQNVSFRSCSMRELACGCEQYDSCQFTACKMESIDFFNALFTRCVFESSMTEVEFRATTHEFRMAPRNKLTGCDFTKARLKECQFHKIDLDPSCFPSDPDILVVPRGWLDYDEWARRYVRADEEGVRRAISILRDSAGKPTIESRDYIREAFGEERLQDFLNIICRE